MSRLLEHQLVQIPSYTVIGSLSLRVQLLIISLLASGFVTGVRNLRPERRGGPGSNVES